MRPGGEPPPRGHLTGIGVIVTRPAGQNQALAGRLRQEGATVWECPVIRIEPGADLGALDRALETLAPGDWIVFTSSNAVGVVFAHLRGAGSAAQLPAGVRLAAIGPATALALEREGVQADRVPALHQAEGLAEEFPRSQVEGRRIVIPRAEKARELLPQTLQARGARVEVVPVYRTVRTPERAAEVARLLAEDRVRVVTFTSASTVDGFVDLFPPGQAAEALRRGRAVAACLGPITAARAREAGLEVGIEAARSTVDDLAEAIVEGVSGSARRRVSGPE
jgi:uroporphyrinogen III methyltransferase/synthase